MRYFTDYSKKFMDNYKCPYTIDMFADVIAPVVVNDINYTKTPSLDRGNILICLTGYFDCASNEIRRIYAIQTKLAGLKILVTETWQKEVNILIVGARAKKVGIKIEKAFAKNIPIVKEEEFLNKVNSTLLGKGINYK